MQVVAISVDGPADTLPWVKRRGLTLTMLSDPDQRVIERQFHLRNPAREALAIHAVYIVDARGKVFYRKVGRRRAMPPEFLAAIDWHAKQASKPRAAAEHKAAAGAKASKKEAAPDRAPR